MPPPELEPVLPLLLPPEFMPPPELMLPPEPVDPRVELRRDLVAFARERPVLADAPVPPWLPLPAIVPLLAPVEPADEPELPPEVDPPPDCEPDCATAPALMPKAAAEVMRRVKNFMGVSFADESRINVQAFTKVLFLLDLFQ